MENNLIDQIPKELTRAQEWQIKQAQDYVKAAGWMLYGLAAINLAYLILNLDTMNSAAMWITIVLLLIYLSAAIGTHYKPLLSIGGAFILYLLVHVLIFFINPAALVSGFLWKTIIVIFFSTGTFNAFKINRIKNTIREK